MSKGFVTIPTDKDYVEGTKKYIEKLGADAIRDCDGVSLPNDLKQFGTEVYKSYFIVREDHEYTKAHEEQLQCFALITKRYTAKDDTLEIDLMSGLCDQTLKVLEKDYKKYWQVIDRTTGKLHPDFEYLGNNIVRINNAIKYHEYTVNFFGRNIWDSTQVYNYTVNKWTCDKDQDLNPAIPEALNHMLYRMEKWLKENPDVTVVRFTSFFYNFMIIYETSTFARIWDWHAYASTASPEMFELFKKERGYEVTLEDVVTEGYYGTRFMVPSKRTRDYIDFVQEKSCGWAKLFVDLCHKYGKKAMMFDGDHRIGTEPHCKHFPSIGLDAVVGAPGSGCGMQVIANMKGIKYTEGRLAPYFFPNECPNDKDGTYLLNIYWDTERRSLLRKSIDRIGFGGFLKQIENYTEFNKKMVEVCNEFRTIKENAGGTQGSNVKAKIALISYWGRMDSWMYNGVCIDDYKQEGLGYHALLAALSGQPFDVDFISFDDVKEMDISKYDVILSNGIPGTSFQGDSCWSDSELVTKIRAYVDNGGGFIGIGEPSGYKYQGKYFQLADVMGVEKDINFRHHERMTQYPLEKEMPWFVEEVNLNNVSFKYGTRGVYSIGAKVLSRHFDEDFPEGYPNAGHVDAAYNEYGKGRSIYFSSLSVSPDTYRLIMKSILWAARKEKEYKKVFASNPNCDAFFYEKTNKYAVINNSNEKVTTVFYDKNEKPSELTLEPKEIRWIN